MPQLATYKTLSIAKKLEILEETKKNCSDREIAKKYGIAPVTIKNWRKQELKLKEENSNGRGCSKKLSKTQTMHHFPQMEIILSTWIMDMRNLGHSVDQKCMKTMAHQFLEELNIPHTKFR